MSKTHRLLSAGTLIVCLFIPHAELLASEPAAAIPLTPALEYRPYDATRAAMPLSAASLFAVSDEVLLASAPSDFNAAAQRGFRGRRPRFRNGGNRQASAVAMAIGAVASITGTALLVYANRPECAGNSTLQGCGYGTKVVGGSILAGGLVSFGVGAATWR